MTHPCEGKTLMEISQMPGVSDLPTRVKGPFAQALRAEANGDMAAAAVALTKAVEAEGK